MLTFSDLVVSIEPPVRHAFAQAQYSDDNIKRLQLTVVVSKDMNAFLYVERKPCESYAHRQSDLGCRGMGSYS
ncbi:MAG: hypothetical protein A2583_15990 [Bdellovibrionales bacterium RIFOXYD1_FULL_53_11]|nr:MAG: hypothetical protein A2583_15990 [Bdellovibrionales bacterium RIFOXYD1_FULL_53_11]